MNHDNNIHYLAAQLDLEEADIRAMSADFIRELAGDIRITRYRTDDGSLMGHAARMARDDVQRHLARGDGNC